MPIVIDLFAGVGGMSLGAAMAGFEILGAVELDITTIETHKINFPKTKHLLCDISNLSGEDINQFFKIDNGEIDGIIGGPPCQGFSIIGKRNTNDPRNMLFVHFFRLVKELQPKFFVAENVPGILDIRNSKIRKQAFHLVKDGYILLPPITINAKDYGVPTTRTRVFFIGYKKGSVAPLDPDMFLPEVTTKIHLVQDAFLGLPSLGKDKESDDNHGWCTIGRYQANTYPEFINSIIPEGVGNAEAVYRFKEYSQTTGMIKTNHTETVIKRFSLVQPGQTDRVSRAYRLKWDGFCPTLRAGTGRENGSFQAVRPIHPTENRVITPREAARLQGFPDWFLFHKTKWHSFRQIGNSVSPIISAFIMRRIFMNLLN